MPDHAIAHPQALRLAKEDPPEVFNQVASLGLDNQESVRHQAPKDHPHLLAAGMRRLRKIAFQLLEGERAEVVELLKTLGEGGGVKRLNPRLLLLVPPRFLGEQSPAGAYQESTAEPRDRLHSQLNRILAGACLHGGKLD